MSQPTCDQIGEAFIRWIKDAPPDDIKELCLAINTACPMSPRRDGGPSPDDNGDVIPDKQLQYGAFRADFVFTSDMDDAQRTVYMFVGDGHANGTWVHFPGGSGNHGRQVERYNEGSQQWESFNQPGNIFLPGGQRYFLRFVAARPPAGFDYGYEALIRMSGATEVAIAGPSLMGANDFMMYGFPGTQNASTGVSQRLYMQFPDGQEITSPKAYYVPIFGPAGTTDYSNMFKGAAAFNSENIKLWDTKYVDNMTGMFDGATSFSQDLTGWCVPDVATEPSNFGGAPGWDSKPVWGTCP